MRTLKFGAVCLFAAAVLLCPPSAAAISQLKCLEEAKGKILTWDPVWAKDNLDRGRKYRVVGVDVVRKPPERSVTLTVQAVGQASVKARKVTASAEDTARRVCVSLHAEERPPTLPVNPDMEEDKAGLPFITFSNRFGWVRAHPPKGKKLVECRVRSVPYSCLEKEKQVHGSALEILEEELTWIVPEEWESE